MVGLAWRAIAEHVAHRLVLDFGDDDDIGQPVGAHTKQAELFINMNGLPTPSIEPRVFFVCMNNSTRWLPDHEVASYLDSRSLRYLRLADRRRWRRIHFGQ